MAHPVVPRSLVLVDQHVAGLDQGPCLLARVLVVAYVRMGLFETLPVGRLDFLCRRVLGDPEDLVERLGHGGPGLETIGYCDV